jgi:hypothetical protein
MKPHIRYWNNGLRIYLPPDLKDEAAGVFLDFSQDYFRALARGYGERPRFRLGQGYLEVDLSRAPRTLRAVRRLSSHPGLAQSSGRNRRLE